jgi:hypothetical protein
LVFCAGVIIKISTDKNQPFILLKTLLRKAFEAFWNSFLAGGVFRYGVW